MRLYKRKGSPKWWVDWRDQNGRRHRKSTGTDDKDLAQALAAKWQQESFMERHFGAIPEVPFRDALLRYGEEKQRQNPEGYKHVMCHCLQRLLDRFDGLSLSDITAAKIQDFADDRLTRVKITTAQKDLSVLKAALNKAHREGRLSSMPPFPRLKMPKGRCRWLSPAEERRLLLVAAAHIRPLIAFAIDTGGRRSELLKLDWRNVDLDRNRITFVNTKNGEDRSVRLTDRAKQVLLSLDPKSSGPVFTYAGWPMKDNNSSFPAAVRRAGIEDFRFHDLRHTFASRLVQKGIPLYEVMHLTGHKSFSIVQRYAHLAPEYQERAIAALNDYGQENAWHNSGTSEENALVQTSAKSLKENGAGEGIRTLDFNLGKVALYP
jgi:integrase